MSFVSNKRARSVDVRQLAKHVAPLVGAEVEVVETVIPVMTCPVCGLPLVDEVCKKIWVMRDGFEKKLFLVRGAFFGTACSRLHRPWEFDDVVLDEEYRKLFAPIIKIARQMMRREPRRVGGSRKMVRWIG